MVSKGSVGWAVPLASKRLGRQTVSAVSSQGGDARGTFGLGSWSKKDFWRVDIAMDGQQVDASQRRVVGAASDWLGRSPAEPSHVTVIRSAMSDCRANTDDVGLGCG